MNSQGSTHFPLSRGGGNGKIFHEDGEQPSHLLWTRPSPRAILEIEPLRGRARWLVFCFDKAPIQIYNTQKSGE